MTDALDVIDRLVSDGWSIRITKPIVFDTGKPTYTVVLSKPGSDGVVMAQGEGPDAYTALSRAASEVEQCSP